MLIVNQKFTFNSHVRNSEKVQLPGFTAVAQCCSDRLWAAYNQCIYTPTTGLVYVGSFFAISVCVCETNSPSVCDSLSLISHAVLSLRRQKPHPAVPPLSLADWSTSHGCVRCICVFKCLICETLCVSAHWPLLWPARGHIPSLRLKVCFDKL